LYSCPFSDRARSLGNRQAITRVETPTDVEDMTHLDPAMRRD
jgi:hypothetical protein